MGRGEEYSGKSDSVHRLLCLTGGHSTVLAMSQCPGFQEGGEKQQRPREELSTGSRREMRSSSCPLSLGTPGTV